LWFFNSLSRPDPKFLKGIGGALLTAVEDELKKRSAPGTTVSVTDKSVEFWEKKDFSRIPVFLMIKDFCRNFVIFRAKGGQNKWDSEFGKNKDTKK
jgi:hypothetical protein